MSNKRKRKQLDEKRAAKKAAEERARLEGLRCAGRLANGLELPEGAIAADLSQQAPNNSYGPPLYYQDQHFRCIDCGKEQVWTAADQKWYFEVVKGPIYGQAVRCRRCRHLRRAQREARQQMGRPKSGP